MGVVLFLVLPTYTNKWIEQLLMMTDLSKAGDIYCRGAHLGGDSFVISDVNKMIAISV